MWLIPMFYQNSHNAYSTPGTSPPTPVQADGITTRSGRAIMRPSTATTLTRPARVERRAPRPKKRKKAVGDAYAEQSSIALGNPLSELVKGITNVTDTDIDAYVNRSPEERRREVAASKTGKVKRPMNAFMLYRKAYQNRTKEWKRLDDIRRKEESASEGKPEKGHDNHQVISQVCGLSWNMEPQDLRDQYDEWAKIERNNHKLAFPDYKFAPAKSKTKKPAADRHGDRDSDDDNASNLDAYEWGQFSSGPPSRNTSRSARYMDHMDPDGEYVPPGYPGYPGSVYTSPSPGMQAARLPPGYVSHQQQPHPSSFQYSNPGKQRPADYGSTLGPGQYYQQNTEFTQQAFPQPYGGGPVYGIHHQGIPAFVENVFVNKTNSPAPSFHNSPVLDHRNPYNELLGASSSYGPPISHPHPHAAIPPHLHAQHLARHAVEHQIDPSLMAVHQSVGGAAHNTSFDSLGILGLGQSGEFGAESLSSYQLDQASALARSHTGSPHPQQFEQAYHTPNDTSTATPGAEGGGNDPTGDTKISSDWETTLGGSADFQLEDIDQLLGTTAE
ncbi:hypothetical protein RRF57_003942 [Xylaria bambusicola]|uniref:HMG box domain-containing protein n=1 Tax=Xylaria bambusicola TaxID=326684 RepID=A0AAN7UH72_9PEZI